MLEQVSFGKSGFNVAVVDAGADLEANQFCYARIYLRCLRRGGHAMPCHNRKGVSLLCEQAPASHIVEIIVHLACLI